MATLESATLNVIVKINDFIWSDRRQENVIKKINNMICLNIFTKQLFIDLLNNGL